MLKKDFLYSLSTIGTITVGATGSILVSPDSGTIRFLNGEFEGWDGSQWVTFGGASFGSSLYDTTQYIISATGSHDIHSVDHNTYNGGFYDYVVHNSTNSRAGTVRAIWDGTSVEYNDVSTNDLGNTTDVVFSVVVGPTFSVLTADTITTDDWTIDVIIKSI